MAIQIEWRNGTAASWTSTNPVLSQGEKGVETNTGQFKIGDGATVWNSLAYSGQTGATQTANYRSFGDGSDGNVTISSGVTTLTRDMYYSNLTINGTGQLFTNNYKVFVKGSLNLTAAGVGAINNNGASANNGTNGASGGAGGTAATVTAATLGAASPGTGGNGSANNGSAGTSSGAFIGDGGAQNGAVAGGAGGTGTGGTAGNSPGFTIQSSLRYVTNFLRGAALVGGGMPGVGGGGGGGDGTFVGGGGGSGGGGGGIVAMYVNNILKSSSTSASAIQSIGAMGGNAGNGDPAGSTGGGGAGSAGGGGLVVIYYNNLFGPIVSNMIDVSGAAGGVGGTGFGTGLSTKGGNGSNGGVVYYSQIPTGISAKLIAQQSIAALAWDPQLLASAISNNLPSAGGFGQIFKVNF
jgi:Major tropism determinant N-terminal domain